MAVILYAISKPSKEEQKEIEKNWGLYISKVRDSLKKASDEPNSDSDDLTFTIKFSSSPGNMNKYNLKIGSINSLDEAMNKSSELRQHLFP